MTTQRSEFRCIERLRVRWVEVDAQKIVFNGHYLMYFDTAVGGYWRAMALPYAATMEYLGGDLFVRKSTVEYLASARYDDVLDVGVRCARIGNSSLVMHAAVFRGEELLVSGELVYVFADPEPERRAASSQATPPWGVDAQRPGAPGRQTSKAVPQELREVLQDFEAGKPMVEVRVGGWDDLGRDAKGIRTAVFVEEQKIPADMEWDAADTGCTHAVAYNRFGMPLATGRLLEHVPGVAKIGRMAVMQTMRGSRVGRAVLDALMAAARERGDREVLLHAQMTAAPFYARAGFTQRGPVFEEAGIPHVEMVRSL